MIVLGFDTATPATAVGLRLGDGTTLRAYEPADAGARPAHTARVLALAGELLVQAGLGWGAVERVGVGVGPGTFTGLRVGVATARGLAQSLGVGVVGVSTPRVLAAAAGRASSDIDVLAVIDARRGEAFAAAYTAEGRELCAPSAMRPESLGSIPALAERDREWLAVGDGAVRFREYLQTAGVAVPEDSSSLHLLDAGVLCELAHDAPVGAPETVVPDYRRRPDAEIALEGAEK